ncbi:ras-related protein Rap-1b [Petromyzon marinus]|uniref:RASD family member 3 n=1 Tax=Petromyzon marinus TaxID=7757 RepID=B1PBZ6_PETMA|nr:ras-related protein Rap-1b-like [Petromyzon marinus]ABY86653.1 small GTPase Ras-dva [Petromyzon marinus]
MSLGVPERTQVRLVFLGAAGVGKTSIIKRFLQGAFETRYRPTVEELYALEYEAGGSKIKLEVMDTSGSYRFPAMRKLYIRDGDAFALVFSLEEPQSFEEVRRLREEVLEIKEDKCPPIVVIANKADTQPPQPQQPQQPQQEQQEQQEQQQQQQDLHQQQIQVARATVELQWNHCLVETSAKEDGGVTRVFAQLLREVNLPSRLSPALQRRRETLPVRPLPLQVARPPIKKANSCVVA